MYVQLPPLPSCAKIKWCNAWAEPHCLRVQKHVYKRTRSKHKFLFRLNKNQHSFIFPDFTWLGTNICVIYLILCQWIPVSAPNWACFFCFFTTYASTAKGSQADGLYQRSDLTCWAQRQHTINPALIDRCKPLFHQQWHAWLASTSIYLFI